MAKRGRAYETLDIFEGFRDSLTPREKKGLNFERLVYKITKDFSPVYHPQEKGSDFLFYFGSQAVEVEAKFSHARIYPSWIKRDWISRFQLNNSIRIVVVNRGIKFSEASLFLLKENKIHLVYYDKLRGALEWLKFLFLRNQDSVTSFFEAEETNFKCCCSSRPVEDVGKGVNVSRTWRTRIRLRTLVSRFLGLPRVFSALARKILTHIHPQSSKMTLNPSKPRTHEEMTSVFLH